MRSLNDPAAAAYSPPYHARGRNHYLLPPRAPMRMDRSSSPRRLSRPSPRPTPNVALCHLPMVVVRIPNLPRLQSLFDGTRRLTPTPLCPNVQGGGFSPSKVQPRKARSGHRGRKVYSIFLASVTVASQAPRIPSGAANSQRSQHPNTVWLFLRLPILTNPYQLVSVV